MTRTDSRKRSLWLLVAATTAVPLSGSADARAQQSQTPTAPVGAVPARETTGAGAEKPAARAPSAPEARPARDTLAERFASLVVPGGLTADAAAERAAVTSFEALAKGEAVKAAEARVTQAKLDFVPTLTVGASYTRLSEIDTPVFGSDSEGGLVGSPIKATPGTATPLPPNTPLFAIDMFTFPVFYNMYDIEAGLRVPVTDYALRLSQSYAAASHSRAAAEREEDASLLQAALSGRVAFFTWIRARALLLVAEESVELAQTHLADVKTAFEVGTASKADVLRVEAERAVAELAVERAKSGAAIADERLRLLMHTTDPDPIRIGADPRVAPPSLDEFGELASLRGKAMQTRLEVRALDETRWAFEKRADAVRADLYPRLDGFADVDYSNPNSRYFPQEDEFKGTWDAGVRLSWSPNAAFEARARASEDDARAREVEAQKAALADAIQLEVTQAWQALNEATLAVATSEKQLEAATEAYRVRRELFLRGRATSYELTQDESELTRARVNVVNALTESRVAYAQLRHAAGLDLPELPAYRRERLAGRRP